MNKDLPGCIFSAQTSILPKYIGNWGREEHASGILGSSFIAVCLCLVY